MRLLFVRHGKAEEPSTAKWPDDALRPLTDAGADRFRRSVKRIVRLAGVCDAVYTSPYVRAATTAAILSEESGWPEPVEDARLAGGMSVERMLGVASGLDGSGCYALVSHDPGISLCVSELLGARAGSIGLKPGGVALVEVYGGAAGPGRGQLIGLLQPRMMARK